MNNQKISRANVIARSSMEWEFIAPELVSIEDEWLKMFLAKILLGIKRTSFYLGALSIPSGNSLQIASAMVKTPSSKRCCWKYLRWIL